MKQWYKLIIALTLLSSLSLGCASTSNETGIRCPKCGDFFKSKQGAETFEEMRHGRSETRR
ncbi:MAG: hypothetical protein FJ107_02735 [Deltaproteobacteria bacterium]|nr:hypothetical protein [Deltaproteobacteria bacterium]